ncbi:ATP-binding protein [Vibrio sp. TRT 21S02]|uniref:ATP-binding protein n=1 Tax=unclassified Vibrio TaxID=2614977 RepID=UPI003CF2613B
MKEHNVINVAVLARISDDGLQTASIDQSQQINADYLQGIAREAGFTIKINSYSSIAEVFRSIREGDSDLGLGFSQTVQREKEFIFSKPLYQGSLAIWYRKSHMPYMAPEKVTWACIANSIYCQSLTKRGITDIIHTDSFAESVHLVDEGEADALVADYISVMQHLNDKNTLVGQVKTPGWLDTEKVAIMAKPDHQILISIINKIIDREEKNLNRESIKSQNIYHQSDLVNIKFRERKLDEKPVRFSFSEDSYPLLFRTSEGELSGYLYDIIRLLQARSGLKFTYVKMKEGDTLRKMLQEDRIDILPIALKQSGYQDVVDLTQPFMRLKYVSVQPVITPPESTNKEGVLFSQSSGQALFKNLVFGPNIEVYSSIQTLLSDLDKGKVRHAYIRDDIVEVMLAQYYNDKYVINRNDFKVLNTSLGISKKRPVLKDVLNGMLNTIDNSEIRKIKNGYNQFNIVYGYEKWQVFALFGVAVLVVVVLSFIIYLWLKNLKLQVRLKERDIKHSKDELKFLQNVINTLPSKIFIHNESHQLLLNNCIEYKQGRCNKCDMSLENGDGTAIISDSKELDEVLNFGSVIHRNIDIKGCAASFQTIDYYRKRVLNGPGMKRLVLTVVNDVTQQKLQERELRQANDVAHKAVQSRERFLATMSHELRTPIAGMSGLLEMLTMQIKGEEHSLILRNLTTSTKNLQLLVNDILDFSKLEAKQLRLDPQPCRIVRSTGELLRIHQAAALEKNLSFDFKWVPSEIKVIEFDALRYGQIVNNLLSNAVKFTSKGEVTVELSVNEESLALSVTDTGKGMTTDECERVFQPFMQADNTTARKFGGTGLGLTIVRDLVKLMGGEFDISSIKGLGTKVMFTLPHKVLERYNNDFPHLDICTHDVSHEVKRWITLWNQNGVTEESRKTVKVTENMLSLESDSDFTIFITRQLREFLRISDNIAEISNSPLFPDLLYECLQRLNDGDVVQESDTCQLRGHILVAEDNPINQMLIKGQLEEMGVTADIVSDGLEAFLALQSHYEKYDLLITDGHMPNMDGYELTSKVRSLIPQFNHKKIFGCTAEDSRVRSLENHDVKFDDILYKPYGIKQLNDLLKEELEIVAEDVASEESLAKETNTFWLENYQKSDALQLGQIFLHTMAEDTQNLKSSAASIEDKGEIAHRIKGGAASVGLSELAAHAGQLEKMIRAGETNVQGALDTVVEMIEATIEETTRWLTNNETYI